ncbi:NAD-dependent epimerase/dehydratase family protein [Gluconacetobacter sacchari]|uniref:NAD-dependent epimerase/dehydratase family protein n=1 Tax=Gluconacetobacter sacchari TaxID=92759 RepID=UPI0039B43BBE
MKVLVTGSNGFLGKAVVRTLAARPDMRILATARQLSDRTARLDITEDAAVQADILRGVDGVVHCAAGGADVVIDGTRKLLEACQMAGVRRVVLISSISVYGGAAGCVSEATPRIKGTRSNYAGWKAMAEEASEGFPGVEIVILRPTIIYGPDSPLWVTGLERRILGGYWGEFGALGDGSCNLVHVDDVAGAVEAALVVRSAAGHVFNVNGPDCVSWNSWFQKMADLVGYGPLRHITPPVLYGRVLVALPFKALRKLLRSDRFAWVSGAPALSELALFRRKVFYPTDKAKAILNWSAHMTLADGLATIGHSRAGSGRT